MSTIIRLLDKEGKEVQDSISGEYEDSFCLEMFQDLVKAHFAAEPVNTKSFIIARVQTLDPKQPDKEFYSYYNAFHLNKTLFQTQIYLKKRYIHRLHVLNPLTNTDIIGNVQYYLVKAQKAKDEVKIEIGKETDGGVAPTVSVMCNEPEKLLDNSFAPPKPTNQTQELVINMHQVQYEQPNFLQQAKGRRKSTMTSLKPPSEKMLETGSIKVDKQIPQDKVLSPGGGRKMSIFAATEIGITSIPEAEVIKTSVAKLQVTTQLPTGTLSVGDAGKMSAPPGTITRFTIPVPKEELSEVVPKTQRGTRRSLSYRNAVSASGVPASFLEWAKMVSEEESKNKESTEKERNYDEVCFDRERPTKIVIPRREVVSPLKITSPLNAIKDEDEENENENINREKSVPDAPISPNSGHFFPPVPNTTASPVPTTETTENKSPTKKKESAPGGDLKMIIYDAVLFATDVDFLETSKTRQIFRSNAIQTDDAKLFEMKEFTGQEASPQDFEIAGDPFPCECCYPADEDLREMSRCVRFLHLHKCIMFVVLIALAIIGVIIIIVLKNSGII